MLLCIKDSYVVGITKGDPFCVRKGTVFTDYHSEDFPIIGDPFIECYSINFPNLMNPQRLLFPKHNFKEISEIRDEKIQTILNEITT